MVGKEGVTQIARARLEYKRYWMGLSWLLSIAESAPINLDSQSRAPPRGAIRYLTKSARSNARPKCCA
jgi:hypothetical protein